MIVQAVTTDLRQSRTNVFSNCQYAIRWIYDLVVLDLHEDEAKKMSLKLVESTISMP